MFTATLTSFLVFRDLNDHLQEWSNSTNTNRKGVLAFDLATVSGCDHLVVGLTHARGGTLYFPVTDVPDQVRVAVIAQIDNSDY